jgi:hypothetical protein
MRQQDFQRREKLQEARSVSEPWGKSPYHDLDLVLANASAMVDIAGLIQQVRQLSPQQAASIDRGQVMRDILTRHGFQAYPRLTQMLLQMVRRQARQL